MQFRWKNGFLQVLLGVPCVKSLSDSHANSSSWGGIVSAFIFSGSQCVKYGSVSDGS